jgi:hypothetical protein
MAGRDWSVTVWPAWVAATAASFGVLETVAYRSGRHEPPDARRRLTLSRALQRWLGVHPRTRWGRIAEAGFLAGWFVLLIHVEKLDRR